MEVVKHKEGCKLTQEMVFSTLKPYCVQLLELLRNPRKTAPFLNEMALFLRQAPSHLLQPCFDFTLLPLLLLLEMSVQCRSSKEIGQQATPSTSDIPFKVLPLSDSVSEGVLTCLEELLKKCHLDSVNQMVSLLKKLTQGAMLSPSEAAEEFREGIVCCFRALLTRLQPCAVASCPCKKVTELYSSVCSLSMQSMELSDKDSRDSHSKECLLMFLQSQSASAAVGHWLSILLQIAETEAARGLRGSGNLREEAYLTLRVLVAKDEALLRLEKLSKVRFDFRMSSVSTKCPEGNQHGLSDAVVATADALAFFLPGVVSRFSKSLHLSKSMISGAAGSAGSIDHAVRGLSEFLVTVLNDNANLGGLEESLLATNRSFQSGNKSSQLVLKALRSLPLNSQIQDTNLFVNHSNAVGEAPSEHETVKSASSRGTGSLHVSRTKEWIEGTAARVDNLLSATFPHLCFHQSEKVRKGLVDGVRELLSNCSRTLVKSKLMLLECLCVLVSDDSETVSLAAHGSLDSLFMSAEKYFTDDEIFETFSRLVENLSRVIFGNEEAVAVSHVQKLLVLMYYAGPEFVASHLLCSPVKISHLLEALSLCLSENSLFAGSVEKLITSKPLSVGYLHSIAELKACTIVGCTGKKIVGSDPFVISKVTPIQDTNPSNPYGSLEVDLPRMPPWFSHVGSKKLYMALAGILRLIGLSVQAGNKSKISLSVVTDNPLDCLRKLILDIRTKEYYKEDWQSWYARSGSGQLLRKASTAVCVLNEIIYGLSDQSVSPGIKLYQKRWNGAFVNRESLWKIPADKNTEDQLIDCVGNILYEYLASEIWDLPTDEKSFNLMHTTEADLPLHFFHDSTMLHQVITDGMGIFSMCLGEKFKACGFLHNSLYLLLQNLICSNYQIRTTSDSVLHVLSASLGHQTVGQLVVANADYIIDSLCKNLRHLDLNPHIPDVIAAMLSYIGVAHEIMPLLEEPMRLVSLELEVLSRHQHPNLTGPFLKAISEVTKASRLEASELPGMAESFHKETTSKVFKGKRFHNGSFTSHAYSSSSESESIKCNDTELQFEHCENMLFKLNEMKSYRRIVGSVSLSCIKTGTPLLVSKKESASLAALDIVEAGTTALAKVEEAYKHEKETKETIEKAMQQCLFQDFQDGDDATDDGDENRLLPAVNKIWPHLILCIKNKISVAVVRRCMNVLSNIVQLCGGDFFVRRFHNDGAVIWKLLTTSPFHRKQVPSRDEKQLILPYRSSCLTSSDTMAETSTLKIQEAALNMIAEISTNKKSSKALAVVLKKVSGLVVGIACSSVTALRDASFRALSGLASIDSDLIWLLLADVYYSLKSADIPQPPSSELPEIPELLPKPLSSKEYLYLRYGGESFGLDVEPSAVEMAFHRFCGEN